MVINMEEPKELTMEKDYICSKEAKESGVSKFKFYKFVHANDLERVGRGVYTAKEAWVDELYLLHRRCPQAVFSHEEAFYHYGLSEREPTVHTMTLYSGYNSHRLTTEGKCKVFTVKKELLDVGRTTVLDNCGNEIPMYDLERTICDLMRSRNSIEMQEFVAVLKAYVARKDKDLNKLMEYAGQFRLSNVVRRYLEVVL